MKKLELTRFDLTESKCECCHELMAWAVEGDEFEEVVVFKCINQEKNCPQYGIEFRVVHPYPSEEKQNGNPDPSSELGGAGSPVRV